MRLYYFFWVLCIPFRFCGAEQGNLPLDQQVKVGKLENGLTYYIQKNEFPKNRASLRLIVKAGSLNEEEHQRGLAHFVEHMVFRGTKHFKDWEIINYLESIGAKFGADANAYTTFDTTCYSLEIPLDKEDVLDNGILILSDWAARANLEDDMIDKERRVIIDEYNLVKKSANGRLMEKYINHFLSGSLYPKRLPIGQKEIILKGDPQAIRDFYHKWYRPDRMAVVVVGDFDSDHIETLIEECFGEIEKRTDEVEEPDYFVKFPDERTYMIANDSELILNQGGFAKFYNLINKVDVSIDDIKKDLITDIYGAILNDRFQKLGKQNPPPYMNAYAHRMNFSSNIGLDQVVFSFFEDRLKEGLKAFYHEINALNMFGPTQGELNRFKQKISEKISVGQANLERISHASFAGKYKAHFLSNKPYISSELIYKVQAEVIDSITTKDVKNWIDEEIQLDKFHPFFSTIQKDLISKEEIEKQIAVIEKLELKKPVEKTHEYLELGVSDKGEIVSFESSKHGYETYILSNGLKVIVHPTKLEKKVMQMALIANGGSTLFPLERRHSLALAANYMLESGFANLDGSGFRELLVKKGVGYSLNLAYNLRTLSLNGKAEDDELLFQIINATFLEKNFDNNCWESLIVKKKEIENNLNNSSYVFFGNKLNEIVSSNHPFFSPTRVENAKEDEAREIISKSFSDLGEYTLIIVGDVDPKRISELALQYLSFQGEKAPEWRAYPQPLNTFPKEDVTTTIKRGKESHCINAIVYDGSFSFDDSTKTLSSLETLTSVLQTRFLEKMRVDAGETYSVNCYMYLPLLPNLNDVKIGIVFTCEEEKSKAMKQCIEDEIQKFITEGPTEEEITTAKEILIQSKKKGLQYNQAWLNLHKHNLLYPCSFDEILDYQTYISREVTKEKLLQLVCGFFEDTVVVKVTLVSEDSQG